VEAIEKEEVVAHRHEILEVEKVEAEDKQIREDINKVSRYIQEKNEEVEKSKKFYQETEKEYKKMDEEMQKAIAKKEAKDRLVKEFKADIETFEKELQDLHMSKIEHERVRNNQTKKKDTIDKAIEEGPKKNLKKLQDDIVKLYTDIQKIHEE